MDLGPCPQSPIGAPGGRTRLRLIIEETPQRAPGLGQESNLLIIGETIVPNLGGSGSRSVRGKANILLRVRSDMKIVIRGRGQEFQATLSLIKWVNCVYMDSDGRFFGLHLKAIKLAHI